MTPQEFYDKMHEIYHAPEIGLDEKCSHSVADALMCAVLESLGYEKGVKIFRKATKWYG